MLKKPATASRRKLWRLYGANDTLGFVTHCLSLLRKGVDLSDFFAGAESVYFEVIEQGLLLLKEKHGGFVYLAINPVYGNNVYKVGLTRKAADERRSSLKTSGVLGSFVLAGEWPCLDVAATEALCHKALAQYHVSGEFFQKDYQTLMSEIGCVLEKERALERELVDLCSPMPHPSN